MEGLDSTFALKNVLIKNMETGNIILDMLNTENKKNKAGNQNSNIVSRMRPV